MADHRAVHLHFFAHRHDAIHRSDRNFCGIFLNRFLRHDRTRHLIRRRVAPILLVIPPVIMAVSLTYAFGRIAFLAYVDLQLNASFSQRLDAISPYVDQIEERRAAVTLGSDEKPCGLRADQPAA